MDLNQIWFALFIVIIAGYLILDGFDMGVGILHLLVARNDDERRTMFNSIGPVWDGNEVWLVLGGGVLFAVFPFAYASLFSGLYVAFMLVLLVMILRTVALEFRSKEPGRRWRSAWDVVFSLSSICLALLLGVAFGNLLQGLPVDAHGNIQVTIVDLLSPFALLVGVTTVSMLAVQGAMYLRLKAEDDLAARVDRATPRLMILFFLMISAVVLVMALGKFQVTDRYLADLWPVVFPAAALLAFVGAWAMARREQPFAAFVLSSATIALLLISGGIGMYPDLIVSTLDPTYDLTIYNAASETNTLQICLIFALIGMPFVLLYSGGVYYIFRGKATVEPHGY